MNASTGTDWAQQVLDEIDYGMLLVSPAGQVLHANKAARTELHRGHPLTIAGGVLQAADSADAAALRLALADACERGLRRLVTLGGAVPANIAVTPLGEPAGGALLILGKSRYCESLSAHGFARSHGLTQAETTVLEHLCSGLEPARIAGLVGVSVATVRTQLGGIRAKTGASSIPALVRQLAVLPPLVSALHGPC